MRCECDVALLRNRLALGWLIPGFGNDEVEERKKRVCGYARCIGDQRGGALRTNRAVKMRIRPPLIPGWYRAGHAAECTKKQSRGGTGLRYPQSPSAHA